MTDFKRGDKVRIKQDWLKFTYSRYEHDQIGVVFQQLSRHEDGPIGTTTLIDLFHVYTAAGLATYSSDELELVDPPVDDFYQRLTEEGDPGRRWWRVVLEDGSLWSESSDEEENRRFHAEKPGSRLEYLQFYTVTTPWKEIT